MTKILGCSAVALSPSRSRLTMSSTVAVSLALLLAPHADHAAVAATDGDVVGKWIADKNDPASNYLVAADASGRLRIMVPAKAFGRARGETLIIARVGPGEFATAKGAPISARLTVTSPRHAEFKLLENNAKAFHISDVVLEKQ